MATVLSARCSARYRGRIDAELSLGDAILIVRDPSNGGDGSVVVYGSTGVLPRNWMPAGSDVKWTDGGVSIWHAGRGECLEIFIDRVHSKIDAPNEIDPKLEKVGAEKDLADLLAEQPDLLETGLVVEGREVRTTAGPMDIFGHDETMRPVIIEVKRRKAALKDLWQWYRYRDAVNRDRAFGSISPRGLIVAPSATRGLLDSLRCEPDVELIRMTFEQALERKN